MKKQLPTILLTALVTTFVVTVLFVLLMPTIGPRFIMPMMNHDAMMANMSAGDLSTSQLSANGLFRVSYQSDSLAVGPIHEWVLHVETADGQIVENAQIEVDGGMPAHNHGLPTRPQVTDYLGDGNYRVEGMKFQMAGYWLVIFTVTAGGQTDQITFELQLQ